MAEIQPHNPPSLWTATEVADYVGQLAPAFSQYKEHFQYNGVDGPTFLEITDADLDELGVKSGLHKKRILNAVKSLQRPSSDLEPPPYDLSNPAPSSPPPVFSANPEKKIEADFPKIPPEIEEAEREQFDEQKLALLDLKNPDPALCVPAKNLIWDSDLMCSKTLLKDNSTTVRKKYTFGLSLSASIGTTRIWRKGCHSFKVRCDFDQATGTYSDVCVGVMDRILTARDMDYEDAVKHSVRVECALNSTVVTTYVWIKGKRYSVMHTYSKNGAAKSKRRLDKKLPASGGIRAAASVNNSHCSATLL